MLRPLPASRDKSQLPWFMRRREGQFGRLKHEWVMFPPRVLRLVRLRLHVDLTILAKLASACSPAGIGPVLPSTPPPSGTSSCPATKYAL